MLPGRGSPVAPTGMPMGNESTVRRLMRRLPALVLAGTASVGCHTRTAPGAFDPAKARAAVDRLATLLEERFVYPEVGRAYASLLRERLASGAYASFGDDRAFARAVTADLQAAHPEGHLRLLPPGETSVAPPGAASPGNGPGTAGWVAPGVAYLRLHGFQGNRAQYDSLVARLRGVLDGFDTAKTLIIDAREYLGGALDETDAMASYFFDGPTTLLEFDTRQAVEQRDGAFFVESERLVRVAGPEGIIRRRQVARPSSRRTALRTARIFVLTSKKTASGGESFALSMKRTGRATLIGETTAGAGHFGRSTDLGGGYRAFIPVGRPFDPDTNRGWELTGVEPHLKVPAEKALEEALRLSGVDPAAGTRALEALDAARPRSR
jgi:hypothetical protein